jgi:hypothetical protein
MRVSRGEVIPLIQFSELGSWMHCDDVSQDLVLMGELDSGRDRILKRRYIVIYLQPYLKRNRYSVPLSSTVAQT